MYRAPDARVSRPEFKAGFLRSTGAARAGSDRLMRKINVLFLACFLSASALGTCAFALLHGSQVRRHCSAMLDQARAADTAGDLPRASRLIGRFLSVNPEDGPARAWHARIMDRLTPPGGNRSGLLEAHEQALLYNKDDRALERRCAEIALEPRVARHHEA